MHITWSTTAVSGAKRGNTKTKFWGECASSTGKLVYAAPGHHDVRQDLAHFPELISEAQCRFCESLKQQNIPGSHVSLQFFRHYASTLTPEMLSPMFWCREADEEKILPCNARWSLSTTLVLSNNCGALQGVCSVWKPTNKQRTMCLSRMQLWEDAA